MPLPLNPKIYHIVHLDRLQSIITDGFLWCDAEILRRLSPGPIIGMTSIKTRRLSLPVSGHSGLCVGQCVPFYFCPRSVMLYLIQQKNHPDLDYKEGQDLIIHFESDLYKTVDWLNSNKKRWAFTLSNAGSHYAEFRYSLRDIGEINWEAIEANRWSGNGIHPSIKENKQAEFLIESSFPWHLIERIGVYSNEVYKRVAQATNSLVHKPLIEIKNDWYY